MVNMAENFFDNNAIFLHKSSFWLEAWQEHRRQSLKSRRIMSDLECWQQLAGRIKQWTEEDRTTARVKKILAWLEKNDFVFPGACILDIGAGAGSFALPFTKLGARVVALEPVEDLAKVLVDKAEKEEADGLSVVVQPWEDVCLEQEGFIDQFDLVFASLTPAIHDQSTLEKMMDCSRGWCFLCESAGRRRNLVQEELWRLIFGEAMPWPEYNILFSLNYLYALGYYPSLCLWTENWVEETKADEATEKLCRNFAMYTEITPQIKDVISGYVARHQSGGMFRDEWHVLLGMILWDVNKRWANN
jgi:SAM-dependent methyltransferase